MDTTYARFRLERIWIWTAFVSWYIHPHAESIEWLRRTGVNHGTETVFMASCLMDLAMGLASCFYARRWIWWLQFALVAGYTLVICFALPEFVFHPFGPITKNVSVLTCLAILALSERR
ncbi:MAG: DoxX-like family protein [Telluria sp.]